jgi:hypothetical protein
MDHHLMMEPAESDQILRICRSTLGPGFEMVNLESVSAIAAVADASVAVAMEDGSA